MIPEVERSKRWQVSGPVAWGYWSWMRERTQSCFSGVIPGTESNPAGLSTTTNASSSKMMGTGPIGGVYSNWGTGPIWTRRITDSGMVGGFRYLRR